MAKQPKSLKGQLLLDGGRLQGSFFHRSVVLVCQHNEEGAFGLILNRQSSATLGDALSGQFPDALRSLPLFVGGPVETQALSYLHADLLMPDANVMPGLSLGHALDDLVELGQEASLIRRVKVFAGYAGWAAGQLEEEMQREAWLTHPASIDLVFSDAPDQLWQRIVSRKGWIYRLMAGGPDDLSKN
jgi:putative transcriptional regulator